MRNAWTIAKREFSMYFVSPVAYAVAFVFLLILGIFFYSNFGITVLQGGSPEFNQWIMGLFVTLTLFMLPGITMRLFSEEQRTGTLELLLTAPLQEWEMVVGKWLAAFAFMAVMIFCTFIYLIILNNYTRPGLDLNPIMGAYVGLFLLVASLVAIGVFASTLFSNQIATFFVTLGITLSLWVVSALVQNTTGVMADLLQYIDISGRYYNNFYVGVIDLTDLVYFVSVTALFLFLATQVIASRRWR